MLTSVDRVQIAVHDRAAAADTFQALLGAVPVRDDTLGVLRAKRSVLQAGTSEIELLEAADRGPLADFTTQRGEGLFAAGFSAANLFRLAARLESRGVHLQREGEQVFIEADATHGMRVVLSPDQQRAPVGLTSGIYEVTNVVRDWRKARDRYTSIFGLDATSMTPIESANFGYEGVLTMFEPSSRLHRIEISEPTDPTKAMGRFLERYGDGLYMCFAESDDLSAIIERLETRGARYGAERQPDGSVDSLFIHPSALHGVLMGISRTSVAWRWSGRPDRVRPA